MIISSNVVTFDARRQIMTCANDIPRQLMKCNFMSSSLRF